ncbi:MULTISPECIES: hypothetical protein [Yersinia]|uniref:hypothetical protein n=1 Tax=Yersinia TaxID=629 RepID=UPI0011A54579|nr:MULTISPECIES: hypothetical protein [Yersinia]ELI8291956.1 hypothetical protein [Yersinia enterocolitica]MBW5868617.1 hypothetical protein [Yersinia enterocolitica]
MKKIALSSFIILVITILTSSIWDVRPDAFFSSTIFTIAGIMFSVGIGLIVTFNPNGIKNKGYLKELRASIMHVRNSFLIHFGLLTVYYILNQYLTDAKYEIHTHYLVELTFSFPIFLCLLMLYSSIFFVVNFIEIQKLNNDIFDAINKEQA